MRQAQVNELACELNARAVRGIKLLLGRQLIRQVATSVGLLGWAASNGRTPILLVDNVIRVALLPLVRSSASVPTPPVPAGLP